MILHKNLEKMRKARQTNSPRANNQNIRKSLTLSQVKNSARGGVELSDDGQGLLSGHHNDNNLSPLEEENSQIRLAPTQHL